MLRTLLFASAAATMLLVAGLGHGGTATTWIEEKSVDVPPLPASVSAQYRLSLEGAQTLVNVTGFQPMEGLLPDGSTARLPALTLQWRMPDGPEWTTDLLHHAGGLASIRHTCTPVENATPCPASVIDVPGAWGMVGALGAAPFSAGTLSPGDMVVTQNGWTNATAVEWHVQASDGCVKAVSAPVLSATPAGLFHPSYGEITLCGEPLPHRLKVGDAVLDRLSLESAGQLTLPTVPMTMSGPGMPPCDLVAPAASATVLPVLDYLDWAAEEDGAITRWQADHPDGIALPAYGVAAPEDIAATDPITTAYDTWVPVLLWDDTLVPRLGHQTTARYLQVQGEVPIERDTLHVSRALGYAHVLPPRPPCHEEAVPLDGYAAALAPHLQTIEWVYQAPEVHARWQGAAPWQQPPLRAFPSAPWPAPVYVQHAAGLDDGEPGRGATAHAAIDPATGWIRWIEQP